jgi:autoinducer 2-degrading protein
MKSAQSFLIAIRLLLLLVSILTQPHLLANAFSLDNNSKMARPYCLNVKLELRPDQRETFLKLIKEDQKQSIATEPGCLQFVVGEDTTTPNAFYLHEEYTNEAGFQAHTETPHFAKWNEFCETKPWSNNDGPVVDFYHGTHQVQTTWPMPAYAYCLNVDLYPKPEVRDEFLKVIAANKKGTDDNEPLCLQYVYGESTSVSNAFHFHEQYTGKEAGKEGFEAHAASPHFADWEAFASTGEPFSKPPVVSFFKTI